MPWRKCSVMDERMRFLIRLEEGESMASLCREFNISRKTGYKILARYQQCGAEGLSDGIHHHAQQAAEAAEAAGAQRKFWEMHTLLFERQNALRTKDLIHYAEELGLDVGRFRNELKNETYRERVRADFIAGVQNGVYRTPGLFLNNVRYDDPWDTGALLISLR